MSLKLLSHNTDLKRLIGEGYEVEVYEGYLLIHNIPYVNSNKEVVYGTLVSNLKTSGNTILQPTDHVAYWVGNHPCKSDGTPLTDLVNNSNLQMEIRKGLVASHSFSQKPSPGVNYNDYHHKMTTYVNYLELPAQVLLKEVTSKTFARVIPTDDESTFEYVDSASSDSGITAINEKLKKLRIAIIGLGGTGAYVLDLVAKTPVEEIHLYDGEEFYSHNAFRSPGAPSIEDLEKRAKKVEWFSNIYSKIKRKIIPHPQYVNNSNLTELNSMDFVFLCIDKAKSRGDIVKYFVENKITFIDVGMGIHNVNGSLLGLVRATACTPSFNNHVSNTILYGDGQYDQYSQNIEIADLNALSAALAVVKWKKMYGYYSDYDPKHQIVYSIDPQIITNEDFPNETKENNTKIC